MQRYQWMNSCPLGYLLAVLLAAPLAAAAPSPPAGTWSVISLPQKPGEMNNPSKLATDAAGDLYVAEPAPDYRLQERDTQGNWAIIGPQRYGTLAADAAGNLYVAYVGIERRDAQDNWSVVDGPSTSEITALAISMAGDLYVAEFRGRILRRDAQGNWWVVATAGTGLGQVDGPSALATDAAGNLYVAENGNYTGRGGRIQKRDTQGNWSVIAAAGADLGEVNFSYGGFAALAMDAAGNLYVADSSSNGSRIQERDVQGSWSVIAIQGASALAADAAGNLYVAGDDRIQKRDPQGNWTVIASRGTASGQVVDASDLAVDAADNLYVAESDRIEKRDAGGSWSVLATAGDAVGQVSSPTALAVETAGNLYIADQGNERVEERDAQGNWSVLASTGDAPGQVIDPTAIAIDSAGNLYVADSGRI